MDRDRLHRMLEEHEGKRFWAYLDTEGIPTVGVGFNLKKQGARERIEELEIDYEALLNRQTSLTHRQIEVLLRRDVDIAIADAAHLIPEFWNLPEDVQLAMVDMAFNLGRHRFATFKKLFAALKAGDYMKAADEMRDSKWARQVGRRAVTLIAMVRGCAN